MQEELTDIVFLSTHICDVMVSFFYFSIISNVWVFTVAVREDCKHSISGTCIHMDESDHMTKLQYLVGKAD